jgi:hypothetical protein
MACTVPLLPHDEILDITRTYRHQGDFLNKCVRRQNLGQDSVSFSRETVYKPRQIPVQRPRYCFPGKDVRFGNAHANPHLGLSVRMSHRRIWSCVSGSLRVPESVESMNGILLLSGRTTLCITFQTPPSTIPRYVLSYSRKNELFLPS